jgi:hypothetical protein
MMKSHLITAVIHAKQAKDAITANIPNAFVPTDFEQKSNGKKTTLKIRGTIVDMLVDIFSHNYLDFVRYKGTQEVLYVKMLKALYRMLQSSLLHYKKFRNNLE